MRGVLETLPRYGIKFLPNLRAGDQSMALIDFLGQARQLSAGVRISLPSATQPASNEIIFVSPLPLGALMEIQQFDWYGESAVLLPACRSGGAQGDMKRLLDEGPPAPATLCHTNTATQNNIVPITLQMLRLLSPKPQGHKDYFCVLTYIFSSLYWSSEFYTCSVFYSTILKAGVCYCAN